MSSKLLYKNAKKKAGGLSTAQTVFGAGVLKTLADVPKFVATGEVEKGLRKALKLSKPGMPKAFSRASLKDSLKFARRASSGSLAGMLTFPLLAKGIKDVSSDNPMKKAQGAMEVGGGGLAYSAIKGAAEHGARHKMLASPSKAKKLSTAGLLKKLPKAKLGVLMRSPALKPYLAGAVAKSIPGTLSALVPAAVIAAGLNKKDRKASTSMIHAGLAGAAASGVRGVTERAIFLRRMGMKAGPKMMKELAAAGGSKATAGLLGGLILDRVVRMALKKKSNSKQLLAAQPLRKELEGQ